MDGHSQPLETLSVRPKLDEFEAEWAQIQAARKEYMALPKLRGSRDRRASVGIRHFAWNLDAETTANDRGIPRLLRHPGREPTLQ